MIQKKTQFVQDLQEKNLVASPFLVKFCAVVTGKNGKPYVNLILMDKTGEVEARIWDHVAEYSGHATKGNLVWAEGRCQTYQGRKQLVVQSLKTLREDEVEIKDYLPDNHLEPQKLYDQLLVLVDSMQDPFYRALAEVILKEDSEIVQLLKVAPAAKTIHHAYPSGLLEHILSVSTLLSRCAEHYGAIVNRDLLLIGGFFHDIGKIWELSFDRVTDYTTEGKLIGHLTMGVELLERKIQLLDAQPGRLPGAFPLEQRLLAKHVILAHHGKLEYGSPKEPACLEALIIHMIDDLDSKVNNIHRFILADQTPGRWTGLNRNFERFFFKPAAPKGSL